MPFVESSDDWIDTFYNSLAGVTSGVLAGPVTAASLAGVDLFVAPSPDDACTAAEIAALSGFLSGGGSVFFLGENSSFEFVTANNAINAALTALGSGLQIVSATFDGGFNQATIAADALTAGVASFSYAATSRVSGGTVLFSGTQARPFVAYEATQVPEPGAFALLAFGIGVAGRRVRRSNPR